MIKIHILIYSVTKITYLNDLTPYKGTKDVNDIT